MPSGDSEEDFERSEEIEFKPGEEYNRIDLEATPRFLVWWIVISGVLGAIYALYLSI
jgi:hypothetical protein